MKTGQILVYGRLRPGTGQSIFQLSSFAFNGISVRNYKPNQTIKAERLKRATTRGKQVNRVNQMNALTINRLDE